MNVNYEKLMKCFECVQQKITFKPEIRADTGQRPRRLRRHDGSC